MPRKIVLALEDIYHERGHKFIVRSEADYHLQPGETIDAHPKMNAHGLYVFPVSRLENGYHSDIELLAQSLRPQEKKWSEYPVGGGNIWVSQNVVYSGLVSTDLGGVPRIIHQQIAEIIAEELRSQGVVIDRAEGISYTTSMNSTSKNHWLCFGIYNQ